MEIGVIIGLLVVSYLIGAIPFGFIIVKLKSGKDIRNVHSGRTGGTNAMRAAGFWALLLTGIPDIAKGVATVLLAKSIIEDPNSLFIALAPIMAILGHNYSIFLIQRTPEGKLRLPGGAGGATCLGGAAGLWYPSGIIIFILGILIYFFVGYASVTTLSVGFLTIIIFSIRGYLGLSPWTYALYGLIAELLLYWTLKPNIKRLMEGTERLHGYRAKKKELANSEG